MSYWPPWQGQPKPPAGIVGMIVTSSPAAVFAVFFLSSNTGPFGCTGQPRCAQRFEMIVKLGRPLTVPLLRMYAVRRETSPAAGSRMNVAITNCPSGKSESGPRSTLFGCWRTTAGAAARVSGSTSGGAASPRVASTTQRTPQTTAITAPTTAAGQLTISPTRMQAIPTAKPIGQMLGPGPWACVRFGSNRLAVAGRSPGRTLPHPPAVCRRIDPDPVFGPPPRHELAHLGAHLDLRRPLARSLGRPLVRRVDPELAAVELARRRVVEMVERPFAHQHVARGIDVRADAEEDLVVVVHVDPFVDDDHGLRQRQHPQAPDRVHHLLRVSRERLADRDDAAVVERACDRQVVVDDLRHAHPHGR